MAEHEDTLFALPAVDDPPSTEVGIILLGLDADRLLAGLGLAGSGFTEHEAGLPDTGGAPGEDAGAAGTGEEAALVALLVDQARHGAGPMPMSDAVLAGARRWRSARNALSVDEHMSVSGAPRQAWAQASHMLATDLETDPATHAYLTACWLRRDEVDRRAAAVVVAGRVEAGGGPSQT